LGIGESNLRLNINYDYIDKYICSLYEQKDELLKTMNQYARARHVSIINDATALFLEFLCGYHKPKQILEVGTAIGYSAIIMCRASGGNPMITTLEKSQEMITLAKQNIKEAGLQDNIRIIRGDAVDILPGIQGQFDLVFLDAAKGQYDQFLVYILKLLRPEGILICDNVLIRGMVANDDLMPRRHKTMTVNMRNFIDNIKQNKALRFSVVPIGDGVLLCSKRGETTDE
jgi:predicted O-methyltransferase YrrM